MRGPFILFIVLGVGVVVLLTVTEAAQNEANTSTSTPKPSSTSTSSSTKKVRKIRVKPNSSQSYTPKPSILTLSLSKRDPNAMNKLRSRLGRLSPSTTKTKKGNDSMLLIPVPSSQQKPYQPVIVQLDKNATPTANPKLITYKLNKMFVPLGIYGKVLENSTKSDAVKSEGKNRRQFDIDQVSLTNEKPDIMKITFTTSKPITTRVDLTKQTDTYAQSQSNRRWETKAVMSPPAPFTSAQYVAEHQKPGLWQKIPSLLHKLSMMGQKYDPFTDSSGVESAAGLNNDMKVGGDSEVQASEQHHQHVFSSVRKPAKNKNSMVIGSVPGGILDKVKNPSSETLEYFRERPHLWKALKGKAETNSWSSYFFPTRAERELFNIDGRSVNERGLQLRYETLLQKYSKQVLSRAKAAAYRIFEGRLDRRTASANVEGLEDVLGFFQEVFDVGRSNYQYVQSDETSESSQRETSSGSAEQSWKPVSNSWTGVKKAIPNLIKNGVQHFARRNPSKLSKHMHQSIASSYEEEDDYELVPSKVFLKNRETFGEIAAVVKPESFGATDVIDKLQSNGGSSSKNGVPVISYKNPNTLNRLQQYLSSSKKLQMNKHRANMYKHKEDLYTTAVPPTVKTTKQSTTPPMVDLSILEEQTAEEEQFQYPSYYYNLLQKATSTAKPPSIARFFAPIPINKEIIKETLRGRYPSPVPRYVVELARKLQKDKSVHGIVRVSRRDGQGNPVEYLYPVRG